MEMVNVRTCDLIGAALDWAVAKACAVSIIVLDAKNPDGKWQVQLASYPYGPYWPHQEWSQGGPLIERNDWSLPYRATARYHLGKYESCTPGGFPHNGDTPLIAACRAIVSAHLGDSVDVPAELVGGGV